MTKNILILIIFTFALKCSGQITLDSLEIKSQNNQLPEKWDVALFNNDKMWLSGTNRKPLNSLAFPVEKYEYYVFNKPFNFKVDEDHFFWNLIW